MKRKKLLIHAILFLGLLGLPGFSKAATWYMPDTCANFSTCVGTMNSGDTLVIRDGTYSNSISGIKSNTTIQAEHDGKVTFTGSFSPGNAGFTMRGIVVKSSNEKNLGSGNTYRRMSFVGGPSCGNTVNSLMGSNTKIFESAFYGAGGRYLLLAYQQIGGIVIEDVIFRPDGGWGKGASCNGYEPQAAYNMYDSEGFTITRAILLDAISTASEESEILGGQIVGTHETHGNVGTIVQSVITTSGTYGRFASDGWGSHSLTMLDNVAKSNNYEWGLSRNCIGTTTATRFDTDASIGPWKGTINRTSGANFKLNGAFLNDSRWKTEMCTQAGVTRGFCGTSMNVGAYVSNKTGIPVEGNPSLGSPPMVPTNFHITTN